MSQDQPRRDQEQQQQQQQHDKGIKYGDAFPAAPHDAAVMQSPENTVPGETQKGGPAATMQSVATRNERAGFYGHDPNTNVSQDNGVTITETFIPGGRIITEFVARQVISQYVAPGPGDAGTASPGGGYGGDVDNQGGGSGGNDNSEYADPIKITIGEALEAVGRSAPDKPVEQSDEVAIQAAEARAMGLDVTMPGGVAAQAQFAAYANLWTTRDEDKAKLGDVLSDVTGKLPDDKPVERDDAARVVGAEIINEEDARTTPAGVAATMAAAAWLNEGIQRAT